MTDASALMFASVQRLTRVQADGGRVFSEVYLVLADLASALAVREVIVAIDDELLGRQVFGSRRAPFASSEPLFGLSGPPGVWTVPERVLDPASVDVLVNAVGSAIAHTTRCGRDLVTQGQLGRDEFVRAVAQATALAVRYRWGFTLVLVRFDVGDVSSIPALVEDMRARLRLGDVVEPFGNDGVALVLPATPGERAPEILQRATAGGLRLCFGLASSPAESIEADALIELAENRLAHARRRS